MNLLSFFHKKPQKSPQRQKARYHGYYGDQYTSDPEMFENLLTLQDSRSYDTWTILPHVKENNAKAIAKGLGWHRCMSHYHDDRDGYFKLEYLYFYGGTAMSANDLLGYLANTHGFSFKTEYFEFEKGNPERLKGRYGYHQVTLDGKWVGKSLNGWEGALYMALLNKGRASE